MYSIEHEPTFGWLEITVSGFWSVASFHDFARDLRAAIASSPGDRPPMSLYNYTDAAIQSQEVVGLMQQLACSVSPGRRVALYTDGRLARLQARRVAMVGSDMAVFEDRGSAVAWLTAPAVMTSVAA